MSQISIGKRVLIVDDTKLMRAIIKDFFLKNGFEVAGEADNGEKGVEMYKNLKPDLVTMDIVMEGMSGLDALKAIKKINKDAKVIIVSAVDQRTALLDAIKLGASDFLVKPFDSERLLSVVKKVIES